MPNEFHPNTDALHPTYSTNSAFACVFQLRHIPGISAGHVIYEFQSGNTHVIELDTHFVGNYMNSILDTIRIPLGNMYLRSNSIHTLSGTIRIPSHILYKFHPRHYTNTSFEVIFKCRSFVLPSILGSKQIPSQALYEFHLRHYTNYISGTIRIPSQAPYEFHLRHHTNSIEKHISVIEFHTRSIRYHNAWFTFSFRILVETFGDMWTRRSTHV